MKKARLFLGVFLVGIFFIVGCQNQAESKAPEPVGVSIITTTYYVAKCALCHGDKGRGGNAPTHIDCSICSSYVSLVEKIDKDMPRNKPDDCTDGCAEKMASYIYTVLNKKK